MAKAQRLKDKAVVLCIPKNVTKDKKAVKLRIKHYSLIDRFDQTRERHKDAYLRKITTEYMKLPQFSAPGKLEDDLYRNVQSLIYKREFLEGEDDFEKSDKKLEDLKEVFGKKMGAAEKKVTFLEHLKDQESHYNIEL